ncbi:MAG: type III polyketide synthase [Cyanothece sp. SIO2G6]|nr:type III polyketide synthase [Cyanothece sp. SIO2G6]
MVETKTPTQPSEWPPKYPRLIAIGTETPSAKYTQAEVLKIFGIEQPKISRIFSNSHIKSRHLCLPQFSLDSTISQESQADLLEKHKQVALDIGQSAIKKALEKADLNPQDIDYISVVSTTGFLCPSLSAFYIKAMGMRSDIYRIDIVGMGCNAGLNGLQPVINFCALHPESIGLLLCVEVCSAMYVIDDTLNAAVVNSLFGDGAAAAIVSTRSFPGLSTGSKFLGFSSHIISQAIDSIRLDFQETKYSLYLDKEIPYLLGQNVKIPVDKLLRKFERKRRDVQHWVIHSGGRKVIDSIKYSLNITEHDVRHTVNVLQNYGNLSSASFLFSYERLLQERITQPGDSILMMTMGPGSTIECCLGEF